MPAHLAVPDGPSGVDDAARCQEFHGRTETVAKRSFIGIRAAQLAESGRQHHRQTGQRLSRRSRRVPLFTKPQRHQAVPLMHMPVPSQFLCMPDGDARA